MCIAFVVGTRPFSMPMPDYWIDTLQMARHGVISQRFTPSGYPLTLALGVLVAPHHAVRGFLVEQAVLHLCLVVVLWVLMGRLGCRVSAAFLGALFIQADPELLTSIAKVWDVAYSTLLLLLIVWLCVRQSAEGESVVGSALLGAAFALGCFDRPNFLSLLPLVGWRVWRGCRRQLRAEPVRGTRSFVALAAAALVAYALLSFAAYRTVRLPGNGPYNLFAGQNALSRQALLDHLNAEPSIVPALRASGVALDGRTPDDLSLRSFYTSAAREYAVDHPAAEANLVLVKLWTLLRPDTKIHGMGSIEGKFKLLLAMTTPVWLGVLLWRGLRHELREVDWVIALTAGLYVFPFLITNADPRFRTPLDTLLQAHIVAMGWPALQVRAAEER